MSLRDLEAELIGPKDWTLRGEIDGKSRPKNTLLEENIEFPRRKVAASKDILLQGTQEGSDDEERGEGKTEAERKEEKLLALIRTRICEQLFDNVEVRPLVSEEVTKAEDLIDSLDTGKPKGSLLDQYTGKDALSMDVKAKAQEAEAMEKWKSLRLTLDSLISSYHIPKPPKEVTN